MMKPNRRAAACALAAAVLAVPAVAAATSQSAPPVGPLPKGPVTWVSAERGTLVSVALPRQKASSGLVWRLARRVDPHVLRQVSEADVGTSVVVVFRALHRGKTTIAFALTRGESSPKAVRAIRHVVRVR
jgi:hypothetical protein